MKLKKVHGNRPGGQTLGRIYQKNKRLLPWQKPLGGIIRRWTDNRESVPASVRHDPTY